MNLHLEHSHEPWEPQVTCIPSPHLHDPHIPLPSSTSPYVALNSRQPSIRTMLKQREKEEADRVVTKCFLWGDVPFNIAKNNPYYHAMFQAIGTVGPDYRGLPMMI